MKIYYIVKWRERIMHTNTKLEDVDNVERFNSFDEAFNRHNRLIAVFRGSYFAKDEVWRGYMLSVDPDIYLLQEIETKVTQDTIKSVLREMTIDKLIN